jgi:hypothetical protein
MIRWASLAAVALAVVVAGCGGSTSDTAEVENTITTYLTGVAEGDGDGACSQLTGDENRKFWASEAEQLPELHLTGCADTVEKLSESIGASEKKMLEDAEVIDVKVEGDHATARLKGGDERDIDLIEEEGDWLISGGLEV